MPRDKVFAWMIFKILDRATDRVSIDVHIERGHEDRYLPAFCFQKFWLKSFFDDHNFSVSWCIDELGVCGILFPARASEKL